MSSLVGGGSGDPTLSFWFFILNLTWLILSWAYAAHVKDTLSTDPNDPDFDSRLMFEATYELEPTCPSDWVILISIVILIIFRFFFYMLSRPIVYHYHLASILYNLDWAKRLQSRNQVLRELSQVDFDACFGDSMGFFDYLVLRVVTFVRRSDRNPTLVFRYQRQVRGYHAQRRRVLALYYFLR